MSILGELTILWFVKTLTNTSLSMTWSPWNSHGFDIPVSELGVSKFLVAYSRNFSGSTCQVQSSKEILYKKNQSHTHTDQNYAVHRSESTEASYYMVQHKSDS